MTTYAIILASGSGSRYGSGVPKQFIKIAGKTLLEHTVEIFEAAQNIDRVILIIPREYRKLTEEILLYGSYKKIYKILNGGKSRKESSYIGIMSIEDNDGYVFIHDCARPFLTLEIIDRCQQALQTYDAVDVAIPTSDTILELDSHNVITSIPNRNRLRRGQTPQCFKLSLIKKAHEYFRDNDNFTDDCGLVIESGFAKVFVVEGAEENFKITYPQDIVLADKLLQIRQTKAPHSQLGDLKDKVIVCFGASSGIGECIAQIATEYGGIVHGTSLTLGCDIGNFSEVSRYLKMVYAQHGRIDFVINCAAILEMGSIEHRNLADIYREIQINFLGSIHVVKAAIPYLKKNVKSSIALFTSSSYTRGRAMYGVYSSCKAAIVNLGQALSEELRSDRININIINPQRTATPMRYKNFGNEPKHSLLDPRIVALSTLHTLLSDLNGQIVDVRLDGEVGGGGGFPANNQD
ncbi:2-C-methyl-D-erythritol 4-phosphate cytidylyltransferase, partial [uncultured Helicobacter sp.]|uniref:2-C-methyl-D-erythritol 4-phosphate cytidylyltransferase n=1 Tax=uncultured Helicobacter sp. TaxID=175537 RepID=UPI00374EC56C